MMEDYKYSKIKKRERSAVIAPTLYSTLNKTIDFDPYTKKKKSTEKGQP